MMTLFLSEFESYLSRNTPLKEPKGLYEPIQYMMGLGGKRIRPLMCLLSYSLYERDWKKALPLAMAIEVFHNFSLIHDDIMDNAPLRRGKPTVYQKYNIPTAILSGDEMLIQAYQYLEEIPQDKFKSIFKRFNQTAQEVCEGQQWDMDFEKCPEVKTEQYIEMIRLKTSVLLGFSLEAGALLANSKEAKALYSIGENIGIGFQLQDDYLDCFGGKNFGKTIGGDILAHKKTFLLLKSFEKSNKEQKEQLQVCLEKSDPKEKIEAVLTYYKELKIDQETLEKSEFYFQKARIEIQKLALNTPKKEVLLGVLEMISERKI